MRQRSISFYSLEDLDNQLRQQELSTKRKEEDNLSTNSTHPSCKSFGFNSNALRDINDEDTEQVELDDINEVNVLCESNMTLLDEELKQSQEEIVCKCIRTCILCCDCGLRSESRPLKRSLSMNSLKEMKIKRYIYLMTKQLQPKKLNEKNRGSQNYFYQNFAGDKRLKMLIASNSPKEKDKFISQLLYTDNDNRYEEENADEDSNQQADDDYFDNDEEEEDSLSAKPKANMSFLLQIIHKKLFYRNKVVEVSVLDTGIDFHKQLISSIYYKLPQVILGVIDNDKALHPLSFIEILHKQYIEHASNSQKLIIIDINFGLGSKCIEQYCSQKGITYVLLDKDYNLLPITLINYLLFFSNPIQRIEEKGEWYNIGCIKNGIEYNVEEAFLSSTSNKPMKRPISLPNMSIHSRL